MNYRHAYHAGNHGDVLKHAVLTEILRRLGEKSTPIFILDTHAGIGEYDLKGTEAEKTGEWRGGIGALMAANPPALADYLALVRAMNPAGEIATYPGSPAFAAALMRPNDRLVLSELHPEDVKTLRRWAHGRPDVAVHKRDGYEALGAFLPPREGRGLVVVDPPFEAPNEFERLGKAVITAAKRWPGGRWMIWHPVKERGPVWQLEEALLAGGMSNLLAAELIVQPVDGVSLAGSGVILINPPFGLDGWLREALAQIQPALAPGHGSHAVRWLRQS
jgi:23S rRNA (adenine2030-N6)-methyltransferase